MFRPLHQKNRIVAMIERIADLSPLLPSYFYRMHRDFREWRTDSNTGQTEHRG